jgi:predicted DNA-binding protein
MTIMPKVKVKSFRIPEEMDHKLSIISAVFKKQQQELLREAVLEIINKYESLVSRELIAESNLSK